MDGRSWIIESVSERGGGGRNGRRAAGNGGGAPGGRGPGAAAAQCVDVDATWEVGGSCAAAPGPIQRGGGVIQT